MTKDKIHQKTSMFHVKQSLIEKSSGSFQTAERVSSKDASDNYVYQRSVLAYLEAAKIVSGNVLEIGTGEGYGVEVIAPKVDYLATIDKFPTYSIDKVKYKNTDFFIQTIPPFWGIKENFFDYAISFQVIEHIKDDNLFVEEVYKALKPGGKFILTTPNKKMSLTRNPWHVREYTVEELETLLLKKFSKVEKMGVFGNGKIRAYYELNKKSVQNITKFDVFNLQYKLPRWLLQIPYDFLNRLNRKKLLNDNTSLVSQITKEDYQIAKADDNCFDLYYIATK